VGSMTNEIVNSTVGNAVYREDGTRLFGFDAELELKTRQKRDKVFEEQIIIWIEKLTDEKACSHEEIVEALRSGVLLCKMMNAIEPGTIKKIDTRNIPLVFVENINNYLKACWNLGIPNSELFVCSDLFQSKAISNVVQNVWAFIRFAHSKPKLFNIH